MENYTVYVFFFILILFFIIINTKSEEKFNDFELVSPVVLKAEKQNTSAFIEWYNDDSRIKEFIILYIDVNSSNRDIWVKRSIICDKRRCRIVLNDLSGEKYNMTILSKHNEKVSRVREIITFSNDFTYLGVGTIHAPTITAEGSNEVLHTNAPLTSENNTPSNTLTPSDTTKSKSPISSSSSIAPGPAPDLGPLIDCDGNVIRHNITTEKELESAKLKYRCNEMSNLKELEEAVEKRPFYYYYWENIFG